MIVCLDYQNHFAALPVAGRPQSWSYPPPAPAVPLKPTMQPTRRPRGPHCLALSHRKLWQCPPGPGAASPWIIWGLPSPCSLPTMPFCHLLGEGNQRIYKWGVGERSASPIPPPNMPLLPSPERRCSYQKRLLKDDLFYFSLTFTSLGK